MSDIVTRLQKLAQARRSRPNMDKAAYILEELTEVRDQIGEWIESADETRDALSAYADKVGEIDVDYLPKGAHAKLIDLVDKLNLYVPEPDSELGTFYETHEEAVSMLEDLDSMMEDRDYAADDRDEKWGEITGCLDHLATGLDLLSVLGVDLEAQAAEQEEKGQQ
jgi:hypothetical protein